ncbi:MAG: RNA polymerase sigma factor [Terracidiphilus sp.]
MTDYSRLNTVDLVAQCLSTNHAEVWQEFVRRFQPLIAGVVARAAARWVAVTDCTVDDLVQETYIKLCAENCRRLREFESRYDEAFYGYVKSIAYSVTLDHFKKHYASKRGARLRSSVDAEVSLRLVGKASSADSDLLLREIEEMSGQGMEGKRDRLIFNLYYRQGYGTAEIARIHTLGLSQKGVESCLHRLVERLRKRVVDETI